MQDLPLKHENYEEVIIFPDNMTKEEKEKLLDKDLDYILKNYSITYKEITHA